MHSLVEIRGAEDDWTGLGDAKLRRKLQNRLNVRAHRKRKLLAEKARKSAAVTADIDGVTTSAVLSNHDAISFEAPASELLVLTPQRHHSCGHGCYDANGGRTSLQLVSENPFLSPATEPCNLTLAAQALLDLSRMPDRPRPNRSREFVFSLPLSSDHLIVVTQFNVLRGLLSNMAALHRLDELQSRYPEEAPPLFPVFLPLEQVSPSGAEEFDSSSTPSSQSQLPPVPVELMPTALQQSTPHDTWIDYCPSGPMRDNLVRHAGKFDQLQLMRDILGSVCDSGPGGEEGCGLIVWQDPWSPTGWELTEGFARKWSFLVAGCDELVASTNRWRGLRGEEPLVVEL